MLIDGSLFTESFDLEELCRLYEIWETPIFHEQSSIYLSLVFVEQRFENGLLVV